MSSDAGPSQTAVPGGARHDGSAADHSRSGDSPVFRATTPDADASAPLTGSESGSTVRRTAGTPEVRTSVQRPGDEMDGDEGSATGSRTAGQANRS